MISARPKKSVNPIGQAPLFRYADAFENRPAPRMKPLCHNQALAAGKQRMANDVTSLAFSFTSAISCFCECLAAADIGQSRAGRIADWGLATKSA